MIVECLRYCWADTNLRVIFLYTAVAYIFVSGPVLVAIPILATQVGSNATALGYLTSAHGTGVFLGMAAAGLWPQWRFKSLGSTILLADTAIGILLLPMAMSSTLALSCALLVVIGTFAGFRFITVTSWIQLYARRTMTGRVMSVLMLIIFGIGPASGVLVGWLLQTITVNQLFAGTGVLLLIIVTLARALSPMRHIGAKESIV